MFEAYDTIEGISVALKVPLGTVTEAHIEDFRREVRITAKLDHPNILPIKNADFIEGVFVIVQPLGEQSLDDRMSRRMTFVQKMNCIEQLLAGLAHAHERGVIHCDIKPDNMILFADGRLRLADFGIAKFARKTVQGSASGSVGYMAPEQALGRPSAKSDVFSAGLVLHELLTGKLPKWPFEWPFEEGRQRMRTHHPDLRELVRRSLEVSTRKRYADAAVMYRAFGRVKRKALRHAEERRARKR
ncbi:probable serine/threonine-protein kinase pknH [Plesiocystis pacifica SIR-1]|uniref:Probable serine/threonine-protein kinase pknH n=1 Tax=Plesiocystis pacifica SIR-1 TaxID=391625 RepID=A6G9H7_9BACT|nr:probable serine/threonine-protein kinase pknH [Plesiocystis pacifica SIR-1]